MANIQEQMCINKKQFIFKARYGWSVCFDGQFCVKALMVRFYRPETCQLRTTQAFVRS